MLIDSGLTWKDHIDHVASNISKSIGIKIAKLRHFVPRSTTSDIYRSLILPYTSYGIILWGQASRVHLYKIFKLQKRALRLMNFGKYTSHQISFFISDKIIPIDMLYFKSVSMLMHDVYNNMRLYIFQLYLSQGVKLTNVTLGFPLTPTSMLKIRVWISYIGHFQEQESGYGIVYLMICVTLLKTN